MMSKSVLLRHLLALVAGMAGAAAVWISDDRFLLSGGSDAPNLILSPAAPARFGAALVLVLLPQGVLFWRSATRLRAGLVALWLLVLPLATHRVVIDVVRAEIRDVWLLVPVQRVDFQGPGDPTATVLRRGFAHVVLGSPSGPESMTVLRGVPPLAIDFSPLEQR